MHCSFKSKLRPEEVQVSVFKGLHGHERICSAYVNLSEPYFTTDGSVRCRGNINYGEVDLIIAGLRGEDTDLYRCEIEILFPPPYLRALGNGTVVYIQGKRNLVFSLLHVGFFFFYQFHLFCSQLVMVYNRVQRLGYITNTAKIIPFLEDVVS